MKKNLLSDYLLPSKAQPKPHPLPEGIDGVTRMCNNSANYRQAALFALQGYCGLRVSEALSIRPSNIDVDQMMLTVRGKGDHERTVPVSTVAWKFLEPAYVRAVLTGSPLVNLPDRTARHTVTMVGKNLGFQRHISSHDLRATAATELFERTRDIRVVQEFMGHAKSTTTELYVAVNMERMRAGLEFA